MNQLVNSALLSFTRRVEKVTQKTNQGMRAVHAFVRHHVGAERRELHQMLAGLSAMQSVPFDAEEPNGTYYEYDRNLKAQ